MSLSQASATRTLRRAPGKEPARPRSSMTLEQFAATELCGDIVRVPSGSIPGRIYEVSAESCTCAGFASHRHCYHLDIRKLRLWLDIWLQRERLTFDQAMGNLLSPRSCRKVYCGFCRRGQLCPRQAQASDWQAIQATAA